MRLIDSVICSSTFNPNKVTNDKGESPLHMAVKSHWKKELSATVLSALLETELLDPLKKDQSGRRPLDYLTWSDNRVAMLEEAICNCMPDVPWQKKKQGKKKSKSSTSDASSLAETKESNRNLPERSKEVTEKTEPELEQLYKDLSTPNKLEFHMKRLMSKGAQYSLHAEVTVAGYSEVASSPEDETLKRLEAGSSRIEVREDKTVKENVPSSEKGEQKGIKVATDHNKQPPEDMATLLAKYKVDFDTLPWEVEVTTKVVKFFKNTANSSTDRWAAVKAIYRLAEGKRNEHLSKRVSSEKSLQLYEARMTRAARIIWEKAISYSAKLTGPSTIPVYTQVIRVWEIVLDHDDLDRRIKYCTKQIEKSHMRGFEALVRWSLLPQGTREVEDREKTCERETTDIPLRLFLPSVCKMDSDHHFIPAASTKEDEYNVTTFYSFDTITVKSMLLGTNERRDFPFKEWQKEHEIIKLNLREAILLLGRSGTGKSTCCLYRLWNEFKNYWNPESKFYQLKIPRRCLIPPTVLIIPTDDAGRDKAESDGGNKKSSEKSATKVKTQEKAGDDIDTYLNATPTIGVTPIEEDLHQVFITKNHVLCNHMKKSFYNMAAAFDFLDQHTKYEVTDLASDLSKVDNFAFPLFLTARQFYILLDNSLGDGRAFFKRDEKGNLKVKITSLDYDHEDPDILLDLEQSDSEDEEMEGSSSATAQSPSKGHTERWTEVTALYFKEFIWPSISHQCGINSKDFDPLLVWIEIQSFIKGSETALRKGTHLSLEEYKKIGIRMAPNFSSHRETIYKVFLKYQKYQQNQRHNTFMFDECDLILHLYNRLQEVPWSIHSIYVDDVQDFTQAELAILIHCCRNPNSMFFTGYAAQGDNSFRFQDLRSSFHQIHSKIPAVKVPQKPHILTVNFKFHSGILKLAGSITDLINEFSKDSADHLPDDEAIFPGPTPVLLESCKIDDLALLLSTNKREASAIQFGTHQVILVQSKEAKDNLPSILRGAIVLTIFEAKGLEFDDVLLYNFFSDSKVSKLTPSLRNLACHCIFHYSSVHL